MNRLSTLVHALRSLGRGTKAAVCVVLGLGTLVTPNACSLVVDNSATQCSTAADCTGRGAGFEGTICSNRNVCIPIEGYCFTNQECIDRAGSETFICRKAPEGNSCVNLLTRQCGKLLADRGDLANDDAIVLGAVWMGSWNPTLAAAENGFELARRDLKKAQGGVPPLPGKKTRPIVVVDCDIPINAPETHQQAVDHLVNDVRVPIILGPLLADWINYAINQAVPKGIAVMSPDPTYAGFAGLPGLNGHYFSNGIPAAAEPRVAALLVTKDEERLRSAGTTRPIKVALLTPGDGVATEASRIFFGDVRFNNLSAAANGDNYKEVAYGDAGQAALPNSAFSAAMVTVSNYKPDIIACLGAGCGVAVPVLEKTIAPQYILSGESSTNALANLMGNDEASRKRVLGLRPGRALTDTGVAIWYNRFAATFPELQPQPLATGTYDLFYYAAFGLSGLGDKPITGTGVGRVILDQFKPGGLAVSTIPEDIIKASNALRSGQNVDVNGTMTLGNFDATGLPLSYVMQVYCIDPDTKKPNRIVDSGLQYESTTKAMSGINRCF